jgi:hypothetical protein
MNPGGRFSISPENAVTLAEELFACIRTPGYNALSKNDFYDFVLHLLNSYGTEHFLSEGTNEAIALLLRASPVKIKASRLNIYLKFLKEEEQIKPLSDFIHTVLGKELKDDPDNKDYFVLTIANPELRFCLETEMKAALGTTLEYRRNRELVSIHKTDFYALLRTLLNKEVLFTEAERREALEQLVHTERDATVKKLVMFLLDSAVDAVSTAIPLLPAEAIKRLLKKLPQKSFPKRRQK